MFGGFDGRVEVGGLTCQLWERQEGCSTDQARKRKLRDEGFRHFALGLNKVLLD